MALMLISPHLRLKPAVVKPESFLRGLQGLLQNIDHIILLPGSAWSA
jgi:hypothetical protein